MKRGAGSSCHHWCRFTSQGVKVFASRDFAWEPATSRELAERIPAVPWASANSHALAVVTFPAWHLITATVAGAVRTLCQRLPCPACPIDVVPFREHGPMWWPCSRPVTSRAPRQARAPALHPRGSDAKKAKVTASVRSRPPWCGTRLWFTDKRIPWIRYGSS